MQITVPDYYDRFSCSAGACPDTCCAGWAIMIDEKSQNKYRKTKGELGRKIKSRVDFNRGSFRQDARGRCAFLEPDGLCLLYKEAGPGMLCETCRSYPRHTEEYEGLREISLSLSCPEAAKLILSDEPVHFLTKETEGEDDYEDFDFLLFTKLLDAREVSLEILKNREEEMSVRMALCLAMAHDLQRRVSGERLCEADSLLERYKAANAAERMKKKRENYAVSGRERYSLARELFMVLEDLEVLKPDWPVTVAHAHEVLYQGGSRAYEVNRREFLDCQSRDPEQSRQWNIWQEQLMVYFVFTYFCGSVYDGRPYEKMKFAAAGTLIICEFAQARWQETGETELTSFQEIAGRYSREVEHSDKNLNLMEKKMGTGEAFKLENLLRLIFS